MDLQAKLRCEHVLRGINQDSTVLTAVSADSAENKTWSQYTPTGRLELTITNPTALGFFDPGAEYVITISKVGA